MALRIREVTVSSGRTIPHPHKPFGNIKTSVVLCAVVDGDNETISPDEIHILQEKAETALIDQNRIILERLRDEEPEYSVEYDPC